MEEETAAALAASRILIVDDDNEICRTLQELLELEGYAVIIVHALAEALAVVDDSYDLLISDLALPDGDGLELVRRCRDAQLDLPVVIMTGYASLETAIQALQLGAYDYVLKPFEPLLLLAAVARAVERQQLRRELERRRHLETVTRVALTVRHEINNPLATILGLAQLHLFEQQDTQLQRDLETITNSAQRISAALQRLTELRNLVLTDTGIGDGSVMIDLNTPQRQSDSD